MAVHFSTAQAGTQTMNIDSTLPAFTTTNPAEEVAFIRPYRPHTPVNFATYVTKTPEFIVANLVAGVVFVAGGLAMLWTLYAPVANAVLPF
eukprot:gene19541-26223_t